MTISEKVAYLKGMMEGMELDTEKGNGKLLAKIVEILDEMALEIEDISEETVQLRDYCDELDSDLGDVEEYLLEEAEGEDFDECEGCEGCDGYDADEDEDEDFEDDDDDFDDDEDDDSEIIEAMCPECGEEIFFDLNIDPSDIICPSCGKHVSFVCDGDCGCCTGCDGVDEDEE